MEKEEREKSSQQQKEDQRRKGRQTAEREKKKKAYRGEILGEERALIIGLLCPLCQIKEHQTGTDKNCQCTSALQQAEHRGTCEDVHLLCPL